MILGMAYEGYLFQYGSYTIPNKFIQLDSYEITPHVRLDLDSYRDGDGVLQRSTLQHNVTKVEFKTPAMDEDDMEELMSNIRNNYESVSEKCASCTYYDPETNEYKSGKFYIPDVKYQIYSVSSGKIIYRPVRIAFIEY